MPLGSIPFSAKSGKRTELTRDSVLEGIRKFDQIREKDPDETPETGTKFFVEQDGKRYPPKWVIELATGIPRTEFAGGEQVNKPLRALGFLVKTVEPQDPDGKVADAVQTTFTLERDLQSALRSNIGQLEEGMKIVDGGSEKTVDSGHVDITVVDKDGSTVVIELKAGEADRNAVGQILAYMGDLRHMAGATRGILVAGSFTHRAIAAASVVPNLQLRTYGFHFTFGSAR
jgi:hypothetical protein